MKDRETLPLLALKALLFAAAILLYVRETATTWGMGAGLAGMVTAIVLARLCTDKQIRLGFTLPIAAISIIIGIFAGGWILATSALSESVLTTLLLSDAVELSLVAFGAVFALRVLSERARIFSVLEAGFVVGAVAYTFRTHRDQMIHRPRFFTDWAWSHGWDPQTMLHGIGAVACALAVFMLLRFNRLAALVSALVVLLLLAWSVTEYTKDVRIDPEIETGGLGLTSKEQDEGGDDEIDVEPEEGEGTGGSSSGGKEGKDGDKAGKRDGKGGKGKDPFSGNYQPPKTIYPVAVALLRDDYSPLGGIFYFRQQVLSRYDGNHLVTDNSGRYDKDVIVEFPSNGPIEAPPIQNQDFHTRVPATMLLLADHPQPLAMSHSVSVAPAENPDPRRFVAAYDTVSYGANTPWKRMLGRRSVPADWSETQRAHYLSYPDDPRYEALADIITRELDPRFFGDDIANALAIKRYLEKEGFYTRKKTYKNADDPAAAFLFGSMRGYCVHFAHSAVHLLRSKGIASRVAVGYAVSEAMQGGGSTVLVTNDGAHAWPEIHIEGVGWVTFDIYPEESDEPPPQYVDQDLKNVLGELARNDKTAGKSADPDREPWNVPWAAMGWFVLFTGLGLLLGLYAIKLARRVRPAFASGPRAATWRVVAMLDRLSDAGLQRSFGETRERFAGRLADSLPSLQPLTNAHLRQALGAQQTAAAGGQTPGPDAMRGLCKRVESELKGAVPWHRRAVGWLNPLGWWFTR